jgi:hypothetical protein
MCGFAKSSKKRDTYLARDAIFISKILLTLINIFEMLLQDDKLDDFEPLIRHLYNVSFFSENITNIIFPSKNSYIASCYNDYRKGQNEIALALFTLHDLKNQTQSEIKEHRKYNPINRTVVNDLLTQVNIIENRILVLRRLVDSIAFRIFDNKVWIAKRFKSQHKINALDIPGIKTNLEIANKLNDGKKLRFVLVSDLTTFIDVGDLILKVDNGNPRWSIVELKTGQVNQELFGLIETNQHLDPGVTAGFDCPKTKQLQRILRQKERNNAIVDLVKNNGGTNIRTNTPVKLVEGDIQWNYAFEELIKSTLSAKQNKRSLLVIDGCFYIFTSLMTEQDTFHYFYHLINPDEKCAFKEGSETDQLIEHQRCQKLLLNPYVKEIIRSNMHAKWSTPFFAMPLNDALFDVLFDRMHILLYLDIEKFISLLRSKGLKIELCSKEDTHYFKSIAPLTPLYKNRAIKVIGQNGKSTTIGDGLFKRLFVDFVTPSTLVEILNNIVQESQSETSLT